MEKQKLKPVWIRDSKGNERYFSNARECAKFCDCKVQTIYNAVSKGYLIEKKWQATNRAGDWSRCNDFVTLPCNPRYNDTGNGQKTLKHARSLSEERRKAAQACIEVPPIKEPKTEEDWEAMRKRALQPFTCSISDEDIRRHEEAVRESSIMAMKGADKKKCEQQIYEYTLLTKI